MKQYEFTMTSNRTGRVEHVRATAASVQVAHAQIVLAYWDAYTIDDLPSAERPAHQIHGEIDCSDFPEADTEWLVEMAYPGRA